MSTWCTAGVQEYTGWVNPWKTIISTVLHWALHLYRGFILANYYSCVSWIVNQRLLGGIDDVSHLSKKKKNLAVQCIQETQRYQKQYDWNLHGLKSLPTGRWVLYISTRWDWLYEKAVPSLAWTTQDSYSRRPWCCCSLGVLPTTWDNKDTPVMDQAVSCWSTCWYGSKQAGPGWLPKGPSTLGTQCALNRIESG